MNDSQTDAVVEADMYVAYGHFEQAETVLVTAYQADPTRQDAALKLLQVYAQQNKQTQFENFEQDVRNTLLSSN